MRLKDKVAIVTGAARGIGLAIARRFVAEGAKVVIADILERDGALEAKRIGASAHFVRCDVSDAGQVHELIAAACKAFTGDIDILVNNAGIFHRADFLELNPADFERVLRVNVIGGFLVGQTAAKKMVAQVQAGKAPGAIVNMSSINAEVAVANQLPYCVSKGGVGQLTRVMALALASHGIRVNAVGPGYVMTEMLASLQSDRQKRKLLLSRTPLGRFAEPEEVASVAAFLASSDASYITGETIFADGGRLVLNHKVPIPK